jgi:hypothetical protein
MTPELTVALIAVAVSAFSFIVNFRTARAAERHARMPVLVASLPDADTLVVTNIGNGPALNVVVATAPDELAAVDVRTLDLGRDGPRLAWSEFGHLQPVPPGCAHGYVRTARSAIGLTYTDALDARYTVLNSEFGTRLVEDDVIDHPPLHDIPYPERRPDR